VWIAAKFFVAHKNNQQIKNLFEFIHLICNDIRDQLTTYLNKFNHVFNNTYWQRVIFFRKYFRDLRVIRVYFKYLIDNECLEIEELENDFPKVLVSDVNFHGANNS
jgi:hypothetical protein